MERNALCSAVAAATLLYGPAALADEGGVSFWIPGFFGSLAAAPQQPGWSFTNIYYHTSVSAAGDVAIARERTLGNIPLNVNLSAALTANVSARADLDLVALSYVAPTRFSAARHLSRCWASMAAWILRSAHS
jgi:hypothetical protein